MKSQHLRGQRPIFKFSERITNSINNIHGVLKMNQNPLGVPLKQLAVYLLYTYKISLKTNELCSLRLLSGIETQLVQLFLN